MQNGLRFGGSGAFYDSARRGRPSQSASSLPGRVLNEMSNKAAVGVSANEIADAIGVSLAETTDSLGALENLGLVLRQELTTRDVRYILSPAGQRAHELSYLAIA